MGNLCLHTGPQGSYYFFRNQIFNHLSSGDEESFLYLLPMNRAVRYFKKEMVEFSPKHAILDLNIFTFRSFLQKIYSNLHQNNKIITPEMRLILLREILKNNHDQMEYFQSQWAIGRGMVIKADQMVDEFFQFGYRPADFNLPPKSAEIKYKDFGHLITLLFDHYSDKLIDDSSLINAVITQLDTQVIKKLYPRLQKIYVSGFGIFSPPMIQFIRVMKEICSIEIKLEFDKSNDELFQHSANAYEALVQLADNEIYHPEDDLGVGPYLFKFVGENFQKKKLPKHLIIQKAVSRSEEVRLIASKIKSLVNTRDIRLSKIGITFPELELYAPLIKKAFREFGIPFNLSTGFPLEESPLIQTYLHVLRIAAYGNRLEDMYKLALSPFLKESLLEEAQFLFQTASKCNIRFLSGDWQEKILHLFSADSRDVINLGNISRTSSEDAKMKLERIKMLGDVIQPLTKSGSIGDLHSLYLKTLDSLGLLKWYDPANVDLKIQEQEKEFRAFNRFNKLLNEVRWILNFIHGNKEIPISDYYQYLSLVIEKSTYNLREWSDYGVQIMPRLEILSLDFDHFFIGGLIEGEFPKLFSRDIFFNDEERLEMGLNASEDRLHQDRFLFYQWLNSNSRNITLSYPLTEKDKTLQMSTFLTSLEEVTENLEYQDLPGKDDVISKKSVLQYLSESLRNGLTEKQKILYQSWMGGSNLQIAAQWENGIHYLVKRRGHNAFTEYEGNLSNSEVVHSWIQSNHSNRPFSITGLEAYAFCPMQYFLQRILKLKEEEEPETSINNLERGNALHKILYKFYDGLTSVQRERPWEHLDKLEGVARDIFMKLPYDDILWSLEKEKYFGLGSSVGLWRKFLDIEKESIEQTPFKPIYYEAKFGHFRGNTENEEQFKPLIIKREKGDIKIYGVIDRIDTDGTGRLIVIDYKTGSAATKINLAQILEGLSLQLPVYLAATRNIPLKTDQVSISIAGVYYQIKDDENCKQIVVFADGDHCSDLPFPQKVQLPQAAKNDQDKVYTFSDVINGTLTHITGLVENIEEGIFMHTKDPANEKCKSYCAYSKICRKDISKLLTIKE